MSSQTPEVERWSAPKVWAFSLFNRSPKSNLAAVAEMSLQPGDRFLDLGCGLGAALVHAAAAGAEVAGVDPSAAMVQRASRRVPQAEVRIGSAEAIPFPDERFTAALAVATYHHWADPEAGLIEVKRVLSEGGRLLIVEGKNKKGTGHGIDGSGADELAALLIELGYTDPWVRPMRAGRGDYLAISAVKPAG